MTVFPGLDTVKAKNPFSESIQFRTITTDFENETSSTKQKWLFPKRSIKLEYYGKSISDMKTLWTFYLGRKGKHLSFVFFYTKSDTYTGEYVGTGDGSTVIFYLPSLDAAAYKVYISGVEMTSGSDYTFTAEDGPDGEDKVEFAVAPDAGAHVTFDFTGYLKVRCKFADDIMDFETFYWRFANAGLKLQGLLNA